MEAVLSLVETIPPGRVMSYGAIAEYLDLPSARMVGRVMSLHGGGVPWHRVVAANGRLVPGHAGEARARLTSEGMVFRAERVDMRRYAWFPPPD